MNKRRQRRLCVLFLMTTLSLFCPGCSEYEEPNESPVDREQPASILSEPIRLLSKEDLAKLGPENELNLKYIFPNAHFGQIIRPIRFLKYQAAQDVLHWLDLSGNKFMLTNMFDKIDYMILSTKVIQAEIETTGTTQKRQTPFPIQSVCIRMKDPADKDTFFTALSFSKIDKEKIRTKKYDELEVWLADSPIDLPKDENGRSEKIADQNFSLAFPDEKTVIFATGPKRELDLFYSTMSAADRGIIAQRLKRVPDSKIDFVFTYDYTSPVGRLCSLPFPEPLAKTLFDGADRLFLSINANAAAGEELIRMEINTKNSDQTVRIQEALKTVLDDFVKQTSLEAPGLPSNFPAIPQFLREVKTIVPLVRSTPAADGRLLTVVLPAQKETDRFFPTLFNELASSSEKAIRDQKNNVISTRLALIHELMTNYYSKFGKYPPAAIRNSAGKPLLSWRVELLRVMGNEGSEFYNSFNKNEAWNSPHNYALLMKVPDIFRFSDDSANMFKTTVRIFDGPNTPFGTHPAGLDIKNISLPGKTLMLVSVNENEAIEWTRPDELSFDSAKLHDLFGESIKGIPFIGMPLFDIPVKEAAPWITGLHPQK